VNLLRDSNESAVDERFPNGFTGICEVGYLEEDLFAESNAHPGDYELPVDAFHRDVLADRPNIDRVALSLKGVDPLQGIYAHRSFRSAMELLVILSVPLEP
jgi:hypothetical protein